MIWELEHWSWENATRLVTQFRRSTLTIRLNNFHSGNFEILRILASFFTTQRSQKTWRIWKIFQTWALRRKFIMSFERLNANEWSKSLSEDSRFIREGNAFEREIFPFIIRSSYFYFFFCCFYSPMNGSQLTSWVDFFFQIPLCILLHWPESLNAEFILNSHSTWSKMLKAFFSFFHVKKFSLHDWLDLWVLEEQKKSHFYANSSLSTWNDSVILITNIGEIAEREKYEKTFESSSLMHD